VKSEAKEASQYQPTPEELALVKAHFAKNKTTVPRLKVAEDGIKLSVDHPDPQVGGIILLNALGISRGSFADILLDQLAKAAKFEGKINEVSLNSLIAFVAGLDPKDEIEATLATHMAMVNVATMTLGRRLFAAETIPQQDSAERALNKLARTFTMQMEAWKRHRTGGEQNVTVKHVTVNSGGQAIVGNVNPHGASLPETAAAPALTFADEKTLSAMPASHQDLAPVEGGGGQSKKHGSTS